MAHTPAANAQPTPLMSNAVQDSLPITPGDNDNTEQGRSAAGSLLCNWHECSCVACFLLHLTTSACATLLEAKTQLSMTHLCMILV